ncbi:hypothetical protein [Novosphingobium sp. YAF33]|uniref:hypothetical protein n=1 Tax=Novosphingobium sp. YAF33 TaxID=3233082 RepID=UPI003F95B68D
MTVVSSILFGIGAALALMTIWKSYRAALPALRNLKRQIDLEAGDAVRWRRGAVLPGDRAPRRPPAVRRRLLAPKAAPHIPLRLTHHRAA